MIKRIFLIVAIMLIGFLAACNQEEAEVEEERVVPVETAEVTEGDLVNETSIYGRTAPDSVTPVMLEAPGEIETIEVANGDQVEEDDVLATISTTVGNRDVIAPHSGEVINLQATDEGDMLSNEEPLAMVANMDTMKLQLSVTADTRSLFTIEDSVTVVIEDTEYDATITKIDKMPDDTGLYPVEATIENEDGDILPGMVGQLLVSKKVIEAALIVPTAAIVEENEASFVYVINDDKAVKQIVTILETQSDKTAIEGDVKISDQLVISGQLTLTDGDQVDVQEGE